MKAAVYYETGAPEVLRYEDAPRPVPAAGEVLIKIYAAAVNPVDWKVRAGHLKDMLKYQLPLIPGWDAAGVIEDVGAGVVQVTGELTDDAGAVGAERVEDELGHGRVRGSGFRVQHEGGCERLGVPGR